MVVCFNYFDTVILQHREKFLVLGFAKKNKKIGLFKTIKFWRTKIETKTTIGIEYTSKTNSWAHQNVGSLCCLRMASKASDGDQTLPFMVALEMSQSDFPGS